jgi:hypothetical protein
MKNNQVIAVMTGIFFVCSVVTFFNVWNYHASMRQLGEWENRANYVRGVLNPMLASLVNDTTEYSKKNPAVIPILQSLTNGISRPAAAPKSATK